jgi:CRISPR/Cas system CSM-associated protein Csm2 small subunit
MTENDNDLANAPPPDSGAAPPENGAAPPENGAAPAAETQDGPGDGSHGEGAPAAEGGEGAPQPGGGRERRRNKKNRGERGERGKGGGGPGGPGGPQRGGPGGGPGGGHQGHGSGPRYVEDRIDLDAEHLARETRVIAVDRVRPLALMTANVRRLLASPDAHDRREARRVLVLFKSRIAFLAGREFGRERNAFVRVRDFVLQGIEAVTRDREQLDPLQVRNFLDHVDAYVGYHRFHADDRRRD